MPQHLFVHFLFSIFTFILLGSYLLIDFISKKKKLDNFFIKNETEIKYVSDVLFGMFFLFIGISCITGINSYVQIHYREMNKPIEIDVLKGYANFKNDDPNVIEWNGSNKNGERYLNDIEDTYLYKKHFNEKK